MISNGSVKQEACAGPRVCNWANSTFSSIYRQLAMAVASLDGEGVLMDKLPLLQNSIKRDPEAYVDEFRLQVSWQKATSFLCALS